MLVWVSAHTLVLRTRPSNHNTPIPPASRILYTLTMHPSFKGALCHPVPANVCTTHSQPHFIPRVPEAARAHRVCAQSLSLASLPLLTFLFFSPTCAPRSNQGQGSRCGW